MPGGPDPRGSVLAATDRWPALADALDGALPVLYRYVYRSTGGDTALTEELTAAVFLAAARGFAAGDDDRMALGPLHDAARAAIARRARDTPEDTTPAPSESPPRRRSPGAREGSARGRDVAALRRLTYRQRIVLALRYHDHLPVDDIAAVLATDTDTAVHDVDEALDAFLAAAPGAGGAGGGSGGAPGPDDGDRLRGLFASLDARPADAYVARCRGSLRDEVRSAARKPAATAAARAGPVAAGPPTAGPPTASAESRGSPGSPPGRRPDEPRPTDPPRQVAADADPDPGPTISVRGLPRPTPDPVVTVAAPRAPQDSDDPADPLMPAALGQVRERDRVRVRTGASPRTWMPPIVAVTAVVLLALVLAGGGGGGRDNAAAPPAPEANSGDGVARAGAPDDPASRLVDAVELTPAASVGGAPPAPTTSAEVVTRVRLGPGGPYMNGPYALDAGDEGLWAAAVGDDGTWQAVRVDAATGAVLAEVRIPGRIPSDRSHHGIAVSGGYVWTPALRDGIFRIDAATNTPSGIVAVSGGVVGAAMDAGDGAVWVVGNDSVLRRIDARTTEITSAAMIPEMGLMPTGVDLAYGGGTVWVTVADAGLRHLIGFDPATLDRRYHYVLTSLGPIADAYDLAADGDRVVITETWPGGVTVIDGAAGRVLAQHRFASTGIAVDGDRAWILSPMDGRATVVWTRTGEPIASAGVPQGVETMVSTAEGGVWAAIPGTGELVRLRFGG